MMAEWASRTGSAVCDAVSNQPLNPIPIRPQKEKKGRKRKKKKHTNPHHHQEPRAEPAQVQHRGARALDKVVRVRAVAAYPVGHGRQHVRRHHEQRVVRVPERAREDHQQEADGQHEGEGDDGFEACCWHFGGCWLCFFFWFVVCVFAAWWDGGACVVVGGVVWLARTDCRGGRDGRLRGSLEGGFGWFARFRRGCQSVVSRIKRVGLLSVATVAVAYGSAIVRYRGRRFGGDVDGWRLAMTAELELG